MPIHLTIESNKIEIVYIFELSLMTKSNAILEMAMKINFMTK